MQISFWVATLDGQLLTDEPILARDADQVWDEMVAELAFDAGYACDDCEVLTEDEL